MDKCKAEIGDSIFLACGSEKELLKILSLARSKIANELKLINDNEYAFC